MDKELQSIIMQHVQRMSIFSWIFNQI